MLSWGFIVLPTETKSTDIYVAPLEHISFMSSVHSGETKITNFIVFGLTRSGLEPTRGEHANHYTTDAVSLHRIISKYTNTIYDGRRTCWCTIQITDQFYIFQLTCLRQYITIMWYLASLSRSVFMTNKRKVRRFQTVVVKRRVDNTVVKRKKRKR
jgi:hypothetical protein